MLHHDPADAVPTSRRGPSSWPDTPSLAHAVVETVREPLLILDQDLRVIHANKAFYDTFRTTAAETEGRALRHLGDGQWDLRALQDRLAQVLRQGPSFEDLEVEQDFEHIGRKTMLLNGRLVQDVPGEGARILLALEDVTDRKAMMAELAARARDLARSNAELEQFAYVASHDLQEPLRMVASFVQLLDERYGAELDEPGKRYMAFAVEGAKRMQRLINDLLTYSRVGRGQQPLGAVDLGEVFEEARQNVAGSLAETGGEATAQDLPLVLGDARELGQVLQNLLGNSIKFHREGVPPQVRVTAQCQAEGWVVRVTDNGIGIPPQYHPRLFVMFQRLNARERFEGTGLGLALSKKIIERHGGRIWVEEQPGPGTTVAFTLPAAPTASGVVA